MLLLFLIVHLQELSSDLNSHDVLSFIVKLRKVQTCQNLFSINVLLRGVGVNHKAPTIISWNNKQQFGFNSITSSRLLLFISSSLQSLLCFISNAECNFMSRCLSWSRVSQRQLNNWRHFLCFPSLYQRWPSLVQKMLHNKLIRALWFTRRHFNWVENVNQFT